MNQRLGLIDLPTLSPEPLEAERFTDAAKAVAKLQALYNQATQFLRANFEAVMAAQPPARSVLPDGGAGCGLHHRRADRGGAE
jgi:hypothetical protein